MSWKDMFDFKASWRAFDEAAAQDRRPGERWHQTGGGLAFIIIAPSVIGPAFVLLFDAPTIFGWLCMLWPTAMIIWMVRKDIWAAVGPIAAEGKRPPYLEHISEEAWQKACADKRMEVVFVRVFWFVACALLVWWLLAF